MVSALHRPTPTMGAEHGIAHSPGTEPGDDEAVPMEALLDEWFSR